MILFRLATRSHARDLSGTGAMLYGGRWNAKGLRMLYTSGNVSLATLEILANLSTPHLSKSFYIVEIDLPESLPIYEPELPEDWNAFPHAQSTIDIGTQFLKSDEHVCMKVPSAIISTEYNYLLNPLHESFINVKILDIRPMILDQRLVS